MEEQIAFVLRQAESGTTIEEELPQGDSAREIGKSAVQSGEGFALVNSSGSPATDH